LNLQKRRYSRKEVVKLLEENSIAYQSKIDEYRDKINDLTRENRELNAINQKYLLDEQSILDGIKLSTKLVNEIKKIIAHRYQFECDRISEFCARFDKFIKQASKTDDKIVKKSRSTKAKIKRVIDGDDCVANKVNKTSEILSAYKTEKRDDEINEFNPKKRIDEYVASTLYEGFDMDEILNPQNLNLEQLCKEIGLNGES